MGKNKFDSIEEVMLVKDEKGQLQWMLMHETAQGCGWKDKTGQPHPQYPEFICRADYPPSDCMGGKTIYLCPCQGQLNFNE